MKRRIDWIPGAVIAFGCVMSGLLYSTLAAPVRGPWPPRLGRPVVAFALPMATMATYLILRSLWGCRAEAMCDIVREGGGETTVDIENGVEGEAAHRAIATWVVIFITAIHVLVLLNLSGVEWLRSWGPQIIVMSFGGLFIAIGNLLPRTRPNLALGIRTRRTLTDRKFWIRLHRTCGYVAVGFGAVIVLAGLFLTEPSFGLVTGMAALGSVAVLAVAYWRSPSRSLH